MHIVSTTVFRFGSLLFLFLLFISCNEEASERRQEAKREKVRNEWKQDIDLTTGHIIGFFDSSRNDVVLQLEQLIRCDATEDVQCINRLGEYAAMSPQSQLSVYHAFKQRLINFDVYKTDYEAVAIVDVFLRMTKAGPDFNTYEIRGYDDVFLGGVRRVLIEVIGRTIENGFLWSDADAQKRMVKNSVEILGDFMNYPLYTTDDSKKLGDLAANDTIEEYIFLLKEYFDYFKNDSPITEYLKMVLDQLMFFSENTLSTYEERRVPLGPSLLKVLMPFLSFEDKEVREKAALLILAFSHYPSKYSKRVLHIGAFNDGESWLELEENPSFEMDMIAYKEKEKKLLYYLNLAENQKSKNRLPETLGFIGASVDGWPEETISEQLLKLLKSGDESKQRASREALISLLGTTNEKLTMKIEKALNR